MNQSSIHMVAVDGLIASQEKARIRLIARLLALVFILLLAPAFALAAILLFTIVFTVPAICLFCYLGIYWNTFFHHAFGRSDIIYKIQCGECGREFRSRQPQHLHSFHCLCPACFIPNRINKKRRPLEFPLLSIDKRALK